MVVKSTPGISMSMPPSLIGVPVAFLPVPRPQTDFFADALPDPTGACAPVAQPASIRASRHAPTAAPPIIVFVARMDPSNWVAREVVLPEFPRPRPRHATFRVSPGAPPLRRRASACAGSEPEGTAAAPASARPSPSGTPRRRCWGPPAHTVGATTRRHRIPLARPGY